MLTLESQLPRPRSPGSICQPGCSGKAQAPPTLELRCIALRTAVALKTPSKQDDTPLHQKIVCEGLRFSGLARKRKSAADHQIANPIEPYKTLKKCTTIYSQCSCRTPPTLSIGRSPKKHLRHIFIPSDTSPAFRPYPST